MLSDVSESRDREEKKEACSLDHPGEGRDMLPVLMPARGHKEKKTGEAPYLLRAEPGSIGAGGADRVSVPVTPPVCI